MTVVTLNPGQVVPLTGNLLLPDGYNTVLGPLTWTTNNPAVATVTVNTRWSNNHPTARIEALTTGMATITCSSGALSATITIVVIPEPSPSSIEIAVGTPSQGGWDGSGINGPGYGSDPVDPKY